MIYLDSAATSFQKPASVRRAVIEALSTMSSPGRGVYASAMKAAETVFQCRAALAEFFHVKEPDSVVFTASATQALNTAIFSLVKPGDRVVVSGYEHNAVMRPLYAIGADIVFAQAPLYESGEQLEAFKKALPGAKLAVCTHVSNVFGAILPIEKLGELCRKEKIPLIVDASQSAGVLPLDFEALGAEYAAMPGHKGLLGPQGTGVLLCKNSASPLLFGGTGSNSADIHMPEFLPDRLEAGTHNVPGIAGLLAGVRWLQRHGLATICAHEQMLMRRFGENIVQNPRIRLHLSDKDTEQTGLLSLTVRGMDSEEAAFRLGKRGVAVRAGLHCAPCAHRSAGTLDGGTVRISFSPFNTTKDAQLAAAILMDIAR